MYETENYLEKENSKCNGPGGKISKVKCHSQIKRKLFFFCFLFFFFLN